MSVSRRRLAGEPWAEPLVVSEIESDRPPGSGQAALLPLPNGCCPERDATTGGRCRRRQSDRVGRKPRKAGEDQQGATRDRRTSNVQTSKHRAAKGERAAATRRRRSLGETAAPVIGLSRTTGCEAPAPAAVGQKWALLIPKDDLGQWSAKDSQAAPTPKTWACQGLFEPVSK